MIRNDFDKDLGELASAYASKPIAKCGDIVTAHFQGYWKKPHRVKIYEVGIEIVSLIISNSQREKLGITGWMGVQHYYFAHRVKANGEVTETSVDGFALQCFTTDEGKQWERIFPTFNHAGLSFRIDKLSDPATLKRDTSAKGGSSVAKGEVATGSANGNVIGAGYKPYIDKDKHPPETISEMILSHDD